MDAMNRALIANPQYEAGMVVATDGNGYWLEYQGKKREDLTALEILSECSLAVLGGTSKVSS
jgi:hypothetical protein